MLIRVNKKMKQLVKIEEILNELNISVKTLMKEDALPTKSGIVTLHSARKTHWSRFVDKLYFDS